jgi:rRNA maturation RNase YbeY
LQDANMSQLFPFEQGLFSILLHVSIAAAEPVELSVMLCNDRVIQRLNAEWRGKDKPTDVLSFPAYDEEDHVRPNPCTRGVLQCACWLQLTAGRSCLEPRHLCSHACVRLDPTRRPLTVPRVTVLWLQLFPVMPLGDVVISIDTADRQAAERAHRYRGARGTYSAVDELRVLLLHGLLHVLGFDHEADAAGAREMARAEARLLARLGWAGAGLIDGTAAQGEVGKLRLPLQLVVNRCMRTSGCRVLTHSSHKQRNRQ